MKNFLTLSLVLVATLARAADDPEAGCRSRLRNLGGAISAYRLIHENKPPAKLSDLYLDGLVTSLEDFICPASGSSIKTDSEIDAKSDYTLEPAAGAKDMFVREKTARHGGAPLAIFADGSIKAVGPAGATAPSPSPPAVTQATASPSAASPSPSPTAVAQATASPASSPSPKSATPPPSPSAASPSIAPQLQTPSEGDLVAVPDLASAPDATAAEAMIRKSGFKPVFKAVKATTKANELKIAGQSPRPGERKPRGSEVTIFLYQKFEESSVPPTAKPPASSPSVAQNQTVADLAADFYPATSVGAAATDIRGTIAGMWNYFQDADFSTTNGNDGALRWKRHDKYENSKQGYAGIDTDFGLIFPLISRERLLDGPTPPPPTGSIMGHPSGRKYLAVQYRLAKTESIKNLAIQYRFEKPNLFHQNEVHIIKNSGGAETVLFSKKDLGAGAANQVVTGTLGELGTLGPGDSIWIMLGAAGDAAGDQTWLQVTLRGTPGT